MLPGGCSVGCDVIKWLPCVFGEAADQSTALTFHVGSQKMWFFINNFKFAPLITNAPKKKMLPVNPLMTFYFFIAAFS